MGLYSCLLGSCMNLWIIMDYNYIHVCGEMYFYFQIMDSNNFSSGIHSFKVLVKILYSLLPLGPYWRILGLSLFGGHLEFGCHFGLSVSQLGLLVRLSLSCLLDPWIIMLSFPISTIYLYRASWVHEGSQCLPLGSMWDHNAIPKTTGTIWLWLK